MNGKWKGKRPGFETEMEIDTTKYSTSSKLIHTSLDRTTCSMRTGINRPSVCFLVFAVSIPGCQSLNILRGPQRILVLVVKFWLTTNRKKRAVMYGSISWIFAIHLSKNLVLG